MGFGQSVVCVYRMQNENPMFQNLSIFIFPVSIKSVSYCAYVVHVFNNIIINKTEKQAN